MSVQLDHQPYQGDFSFLSPATASSLIRNGKVLITRDPDGNTASSQGMDFEQHTLPVYNARHLLGAARPTCERNGFELLKQPLLNDRIDFTDHHQVVNSYYKECENIVATATGAQAFAFDHNVRSAQGKQSRQRLTGGQEVQEPAHIVHGDYTLTSAPERLMQLSQPPAGNDTLMGFLEPGEALIKPEQAQRVRNTASRYAIINVWRNIKDTPVATHPLALCDSQSVSAEDLVVFEIHYPNRVGENYFAKFSPDHKMYFYPDMTRDEPLLIKQWDSAGPLAVSGGKTADGQNPDAPCTFSFHSAFNNPQTPADAADRWSIEVRCLVLYPMPTCD